MTTTEIRGPRKIEDAAIEHVVELERAEGRRAAVVEGADGVVSGDRVIAVKACGGTSCGAELLLECSQFVAARDDPELSWLYLVENVAQGDPAAFRVIRIGGQRLQELLEHARERRYWTVPVPDRMYAEFGDTST
ncbi:hypothetical protein [Trujillonella humicola]|uniref:hypothetical protein n=1 Tax=Trujillonella humicola TaxID=3383699 RepID=UPI003906BD9D